MSEVDCYPDPLIVDPDHCRIVDGETIAYSGPISEAPDFDAIPPGAKVYVHPEVFRMIVDDYRSSGGIS